MHIVYIDDTGDDRLYGFAALAIPATDFRSILLRIIDFRRELRDSDGIYVTKEQHAWKFVSGRGKIGHRTVPKGRRAQIFRDTLAHCSSLPGVKLFTAFGARDSKLQTLERMLNRINRAMQDWESRAILVFDEGEERAYTRLTRRMAVFNPIRSQYGRWPEGSEFRNIPTDLIIEDPNFRRSSQSFFIQLADFCGYALLQKERPTPGRMRYNIHETFPVLRPICVTEANPQDEFGIIRTPTQH
jgi:hypothetical protein